MNFTNQAAGRYRYAIIFSEGVTDCQKCATELSLPFQIIFGSRVRRDGKFLGVVLVAVSLNELSDLVSQIKYAWDPAGGTKKSRGPNSARA